MIRNLNGIILWWQLVVTALHFSAAVGRLIFLIYNHLQRFCSFYKNISYNVTFVLRNTQVYSNTMSSTMYRYLIPCNHVMLSQRRAVKDLDLYSKTADKFLSLVPLCCRKERLVCAEKEEEHATWSKGERVQETGVVLNVV